MTKLNGTSGQAFSGLAETLNMRGTSRSTKGAGAKSQADSSFNDLLRNVSNLAKKALNDANADTSVKAASLRSHLAPPAEGKTSDETVHERTDPVDEARSSRKSSDLPSEGPADPTAKVDVTDRSSVVAMAGQELAAAPAAKSQIPSAMDDRKDAAREERPSTTRRETRGADTAKNGAVDSAPSVAAPTGARSASQAAAATPQGSDVTAKPMPAASGFEAVTANVERAVKASAREALPEATKVTVLQQETHLPPAQFNAPQQVASAVVAELKESAAASALPDPTASQANAPDQPLKILTINLEPPALGNVTVRLRLVGTEVSVHLAAERKDTSQLLDQQRDSIRDLMQSAGYVADVAPVQHGTLDGFQSGSGQSQSQLSSQQQPPSQSQGSFGGASSSSGQSDGEARQARQERQPNQETRHDQDVAPQIRRGPVYL
ncbi:flagellar hook-length control protein FliK [Bradyrhizobium daqingense]|uniref:Chemotaxis protein MotD n=1 Tax=Bradyrhizobium daqingense TaxID=993502 RepID=A0A562LA50_9BRAD|nr:flagellar hook-length control protein FliK [Bradyrhizobium daqingense]TWI04436.1 chemotaxis protein MotD [Bradyrhizobium daqingense]UFS91641.1 flagellar hook-length control protein FliK [Bradyrhizobium daqingense]